MMAKMIAYGLVGICLGPLASLAITPIFMYLRIIFFVPFIRRRLWEEAERKGHVIEASLKKTQDLTEYDTELGRVPTMRKMGTYSYQVNGKNYTYRGISSNRLPETITLYYIKKPKKATLSNRLGNWEQPWLKCYLGISLFVTIATVIVGMIIG